jgi:hypothetical protein
MVSHFFLPIDQFSGDQKIHENLFFLFGWTENFDYICSMKSTIIIQYRRNKRVVETMVAPLTKLVELRHHITKIEENLNGSVTIYVTINIK